MLEVCNNYQSYTCPLCDSDDIRKIGNIYLDGPISFSSIVINLKYTSELFECRNCLSWFKNYIIDSETAYYLYKIGNASEKWHFNNRSFEEKMEKKVIETLKSLFFEGCRILDIGCNTGELLDFAKNYGCITFGVEYSDSSRYFSERKGHKVFYQIEDIKNMQFDVIVAFNLIEHLYDAPKFFKKCHELLNEKGKLLILTGNKDSLTAKLCKNKWWYLKYPEHIIFPSKNFYKYYSGFAIERIIPCYAELGYKVEPLKVIYGLFTSIIKGRYAGLPSLGPDHFLGLLSK